MSHLTRCNHCTMRWLERDAAEHGKVITVRPSRADLKLFTEAAEVFIHDPGEQPADNAEPVAWFMALSKECAC